MIKLGRYGSKNLNRLKNLDIFTDNPTVIVFMGHVDALRHLPYAMRHEEQSRSPKRTSTESASGWNQIIPSHTVNLACLKIISQ